MNEMDLDSPPPYYQHQLNLDGEVHREVECENIGDDGEEEESSSAKNHSPNIRSKQQQQHESNKDDESTMKLHIISPIGSSNEESSNISSSTTTPITIINNNTSIFTSPLEEEKKNLNFNSSDSGSNVNSSPPIKIRKRTHSNLNSNNNNCTNGDINSNNNNTRQEYEGKIPVMILQVIDVLLGGGIVFILVLGIIKIKIPLLIFGGFGVLMLLAAIIGFIGLFLSKSRVIILYYYWKWACIPILIAICITLGVLVKYDYLFLNESTVWWANVIIIGGVGFLLILWTLTSIIWLLPLIKEVRSIQAVVLKEIHIDEENHVSIPKSLNKDNNNLNLNLNKINNNNKTPELNHNYSSINNSNAINIVNDNQQNQTGSSITTTTNNIKLNNSNNGRFDIDDSDSVELLDQMTPRPQYGVLQPEDPLIVAVRKFNKNPISGVKYIMENGLLNQIRGGVDLVTFLHCIDELSKVKVGEFLCENTPYHKEICSEFVGRYNFVSKEFDESLREFLSKFRLPGEAQKIDRMMERFAIKYHKDNPDIFPDSDTAYILAFSLIILNTDAHNPAIKNKMSKKGFIQNNTGFKGKKDLPIEYLEKLYDRIINRELKMDSESMFTNAQMKGWLYKMTSNQKKWQKRWFVLKGNCLYYFMNDQKDEEESPKVIIPLEGLKVTKITDLILEIEDSTIGTIKSVKLTPSGPVEGSHNKYQLKSQSIEDTERWLEAIRNNTLGSPVLLLIKKKKKLLDLNGNLSSPYNDRRKSVIESTPTKQNNFLLNNNNNNNNNSFKSEANQNNILTPATSTTTIISDDNTSVTNNNNSSYVKRELSADDFTSESFDDFSKSKQNEDSFKNE